MYKDWEIAHQRRDSTSSIPGPIGIQNIGFWGEGKTGVPKENHPEQRGEPTTNSTYIWCQHSDLSQGHIGGRRVLSPLHHPCSSSQTTDTFIPSLRSIKLPHSDVHTVDQCLRCGYSKWKMKWCNLHNKKMMVSSARVSKTILLCTEHIVHTISRYLMISEWSISHK